MEDADPNKLFEAANVYKIKDSDQYFLIVKAIDSGHRYFRSWTATSLESDEWTALADSEEELFAGANNVVFEGTSWTQSVSHEEMIRSQVDQIMIISPCSLRYMYQGVDPAANDDYNSLPWKLGLLTQTIPAC